LILSKGRVPLMGRTEVTIPLFNRKMYTTIYIRRKINNETF